MGRVRFAFALAAGLALACAARADVIYNFVFMSSAQEVDAEGTFSTGAASTQDAGYFLVTDVTFTSLRDMFTETLDTGSVTATSLKPGAAYDPKTEGFVNHGGGSTNNIGEFSVSCNTKPFDFALSQIEASSFTQENINDQSCLHRKTACLSVVTIHF
jgi:hypothetical protein